MRNLEVSKEDEVLNNLLELHEHVNVCSSCKIQTKHFY